MYQVICSDNKIALFINTLWIFDYFIHTQYAIKYVKCQQSFAKGVRKSVKSIFRVNEIWELMLW